MSLYYDFKTACLKNGNKNAVYFKNRYYTGQQLIELVDSLSSYLKDTLHLHQSVVVTLCLENSLFSFLMIYACNKLGMIVNLVNPSLPSDQSLYFDLQVKTRMFFVDKTTYVNNYDVFKNIKNKIVLIDFNDSKIEKLIFNLKHRNILNDGVPFNFKIKKHKKAINYPETNKDSDIAFVAPNEHFDEMPDLVSINNIGLHQSLINQSDIFINCNEQGLILPFVSIMSLPLFLGFFHTPVCSGLCVCLDNLLIQKRLIKVIKNKKILYICGDIGSYQTIFSYKEKLLAKLLNGLDCAFIYNDFNRSETYKAWKNKCRIYCKNIPLYSLVGSVETLGAFAFNDVDDPNASTLVKFVGDFKPEILNPKRKTHIGQLKLHTNCLMVGYFQNPAKSEKLLDGHNGLLTNFNGWIDSENNFHLSNSIYQQTPYIHNAPYLKNLKDMLMTIPGVKGADISVCLTKTNTVLLNIIGEKESQIRIEKDISDYLDKQLKTRSFDYKITFLD